MSQSQPLTLAVVGAGSMASAILAGAFRSGVLEPAEVVVAEPDDARRAKAQSQGCAVATGAAGAIGALAPGGSIMLAVKPQALAAVARELHDAGAGAFDGVAISILAGASSARVREALGGGARVVRVMPNTPARVGMGISAVALGAGARTGDDELAMRLFSAVGEVVRIDEALMDAFTALAGSGPAYIFYLAEALARAGEAVGFDGATADRVARAVIRGSAELLAQARDESAGALRTAVTSKGGTTEAALRVLDERNVADAIVRAVAAARDRGAELAKSS